MRLAAFIAGALLVAGCQPDASVPAREENALTQPPANLTQPQPDSPASGAEVGNDVILPNDPQDDPALAGMSESRRREYARGYRDCARGDYDYDPERQGESYRIGCMAAENLKAGPDH